MKKSLRKREGTSDILQVHIIGNIGRVISLRNLPGSVKQRLVLLHLVIWLGLLGRAHIGDSIIPSGVCKGSIPIRNRPLIVHYVQSHRVFTNYLPHLKLQPKNGLLGLKSCQYPRTQKKIRNRIFNSEIELSRTYSFDARGSILHDGNDSQAVLEILAVMKN